MLSKTKKLKNIIIFLYITLDITTRQNTSPMSSHKKTEVSALDSKKISSKVSTLKYDKTESPSIINRPTIGCMIKSDTKKKSDPIFLQRSSSFDDYFKERLLLPPIETREEERELERETNDYEDDYNDHHSDDGYDSFEEEEYCEHEYIEKADARPTTVRAGGGGTKIPFHSGKGTRMKEANIAKGTVLLPNGNILIK